ncbi:MAG: hypothetical protein O3B87_04030, partial [bacterium]|nr:hypothetical protein [bacterium]
MKLVRNYLIIFLFLVGILLLKPTYSIADQKGDLENKIQEYESKLKQLKSEKDTLSSQIEYMRTQEYITTLQIEETEEKITKTEKEISVLGARINSLDSSLDTLSKTLIERITASYKNRKASLVDIVLDSTNASMLTNRLKYYQIARTQNQKALLQVMGAKTNFEEQKDLRERKIEELDTLKVSLDIQQDSLIIQQSAKENLLSVTKNDENTYQQLLAQARAEHAAIKGIISGAGTEVEMRSVSKGETIASVIPGVSCNSSGGHLHFIVQDGTTVVNPFNHLKSVEFENCSGSGCGSGDGDAFNPSGSWDWPLNPTIRMS